MDKIISQISNLEVDTKSILQLTEENPLEYVDLVSRKTCIDFVAGNYSHKGYEIEVTSEPTLVYTKNGTSGFEIYARVFKDGKQIGFGDDGSIDIERFRTYGRSNFLVEDPKGDIIVLVPIRTSPDDKNPVIIEKIYREDLVYCVLDDLVHTVSLVGKGDSNIKQGKVGKTTDTFNPPRLTGQGSMYFYYRADTDGSGGTFASWRSSAVVANQNIGTWVNHAGNLDPDALYIQMNQLAGNAWQWNVRIGLQFDTSSIPDGDTISSATLSFNRNDSIIGAAGDNLTTNMVLTAWTPASATSWVKADTNTYSGTHLSSDLAWSSIAAVGTYTDITLNSSGNSNISKTGYTYIMMRVHWDADNTNPGTTGVHQVICGFDTGNDTKPAKLVVVHAVAATSGFFGLM